MSVQSDLQFSAFSRKEKRSIHTPSFSARLFVAPVCPHLISLLLHAAAARTPPTRVHSVAVSSISPSHRTPSVSFLHAPLHPPTRYSHRQRPSVINRITAIIIFNAAPEISHPSPSRVFIPLAARRAYCRPALRSCRVLVQFPPRCIH